jgi:hypothetical protein
LNNELSPGASALGPLKTLSGVLKSLKCFSRRGRTFDLDGILLCVQGYVAIVIKCSALKLSKDRVVKMFLDNLNDESFKNYLSLYDIKA